MPAVDLGIDLGELPDEPQELYTLATVAHVACGGHAGDLKSMARAVSFALARGVRLSAHPSYPDRAGFGRARMDLAASALAESVREQCATHATLATRMGHRVTKMKPHGALYHAAAEEPETARAVLDGATQALGDEVTIVGPPRGALLDLARERGLAYAREGFADRGYLPNGSLIPRGEPGALLADPRACSKQAIALAGAGGLEILCVHGDSPGAVDAARAVRGALEGASLLVTWA